LTSTNNGADPRDYSMFPPPDEPDDVPRYEVNLGDLYVDLLSDEALDTFFNVQRQEAPTVPPPLDTWRRACLGAGGGKGMALGWQVIVGGKSNVGKSNVGLNVIAAAVMSGARVGLVNLEMGPQETCERLLPLLTGVTSNRIRRAHVEDLAEQEIRQHVQRLVEKPERAIFTNVGRITDLSQVHAMMLKWKLANNVKLIVVDYLQLCGTRHSEEQIRASVTEIAARMFDFARDHEVLVIGLSQLNRLASNDASRTPTVQDLYGSSALENNSDQILMLDHSRYENVPGQPRARTYVVLGKNRHGPKGLQIPVEWDFRTFRMREAEPDEEQEHWPGAASTYKTRARTT
jgi:replicative DNA helicase